MISNEYFIVVMKYYFYFIEKIEAMLTYVLKKS